MLHIPDHILKKLQCVQCGGYLSCGPAVINEQHEQLCGRCFKILPDDLKSKCFRQIGFEATAELLIFPCKYKTQGCAYTFPWNQGCQHETTCQHRNNTLPLDDDTVNNTVSDCPSNEFDVKVDCVNTNLDIEDRIKLHVEIAGKKGNKLYLNNRADNVKLNLELVVAVDLPKLVYCYIFSEKQMEEHLYDSVSYLMHIRCANCHKNILNSEVFHCPFGHTLCKLCKTSTCVICGSFPNSGSQHYCRNYVKGCTNLLPTLDIARHETDCEFNDFKCPLCEFVGSLNNLIAHFMQSHEVVSSNELSVSLSPNDRVWYLHCHNKLFRFMYYNFDDSVEFIVSYIGSNENARKYKYEVTLFSEVRNVSRGAKCLGWNEVSLGRTALFEVGNELRKNLKVRVVIL